MGIFVCQTCGGEIIIENGVRRCRYCGRVYSQINTDEEVNLLIAADQKLRLANFDDATDCYLDIITRFPRNADAHWGLVLARYGIKYERDYDGRLLPTCYATSYESFLTDRDYLKALALADKDGGAYMREQAALIERNRIEWVNKASKEPPYDIFICYKDSDESKGIERTEDSRDAYEIYNHLTEQGYRVFYSRESLLDKVGEQKFEPYIFNALVTAKVMLIYCTDPEYPLSTWMYNEWSRYRKYVRERKKQPDSQIVVFKNFNASQLPAPLNSMQCLSCADTYVFYTTLFKRIGEIMAASGSTVSAIKRIDLSSRVPSAGRAKAVRNALSVTLRELHGDAVEGFSADESANVKKGYVYLRNSLFDDAIDVFSRLTADNPSNSKAIIGLSLAYNRVKDVSDASQLAAIPDFDKTLIQAIGTASREYALSLLDVGRDVTLSALENGDFAVAALYYDLCKSYVYEGNAELEQQAVAVTTRLIGKQNGDELSALIDKILKYSYDEGEDVYIGIAAAYAERFHAVGDYANAVIYYDKLLALKDDKEIMWRKLLATLGTSEHLNGVIDGLKDTADLEELLSICTAEEVLSYLNELLSAVIEELDESGDESDLCEVFDTLIRYVPEESDEFLIIKLLAMGKACLSGEFFEAASKYYKLVLSENNHIYAAYWGCLQAKLECKDDGEIIESDSVVSDFPEFHNAVDCAATCDEATMIYYIETAARQKEAIAQRKRDAALAREQARQRLAQELEAEEEEKERLKEEYKAAFRSSLKRIIISCVAVAALCVSLALHLPVLIRLFINGFGSGLDKSMQTAVLAAWIISTVFSAYVAVRGRRFINNPLAATLVLALSASAVISSVMFCYGMFRANMFFGWLSAVLPGACIFGFGLLLCINFRSNKGVITFLGYVYAGLISLAIHLVTVLENSYIAIVFNAILILLGICYCAITRRWNIVLCVIIAFCSIFVLLWGYGTVDMRLFFFTVIAVDLAANIMDFQYYGKKKPDINSVIIPFITFCSAFMLLFFADRLSHLTVAVYSTVMAIGLFVATIDDLSPLGLLYCYGMLCVIPVFNLLTAVGTAAVSYSVLTALTVVYLMGAFSMKFEKAKYFLPYFGLIAAVLSAASVVCCYYTASLGVVLPLIIAAVIVALIAVNRYETGSASVLFIIANAALAIVYICLYCIGYSAFNADYGIVAAVFLPMFGLYAAVFALEIPCEGDRNANLSLIILYAYNLAAIAFAFAERLALGVTFGNAIYITCGVLTLVGNLVAVARYKEESKTFHGIMAIMAAALQCAAMLIYAFLLT